MCIKSDDKDQWSFTFCHHLENILQEIYLHTKGLAHHAVL